MVINQQEIEVLGNSLRQIDPKWLKPAEDEHTVKFWYQGGEPYFDMFINLRHEEIVWFQFTLRGQTLSWSDKTPRLQTGTTNEMQIDDVSYYAASKVIHTASTPDATFVQLVRSILQTRSGDRVFDQAIALLESEAYQVAN